MDQELIKKLEELVKIYRGEIDVPRGFSLFSGETGVFLFRLNAQRFLDVRDEQLEGELFEFLSERLQSNSKIVSFGNGVAGFAWFLQHICEMEFLDLDEALFETYDTFILDAVRRDFSKNNHDFMHGAIGEMLYLINRFKGKQDKAEELNEVYNLLMDSASMNKQGVFWLEDDNYLAADEKGNAIINFHMSHGQASKIVILSKLVEAGIDEAKESLINAVNFVLAHEKDEIIPYQLKNGEPLCKTHSGWCRSNIAIGLAVMQAAEVLNNNGFKERATQIGLYTLKRETIQNKRYSDAALCHGSAGISHMYLRYYQYTKIEAFKEVAQDWMKETITAAVYEDGIAGFKSWEGMEQRLHNDFGLLTGTAGIGLAILSHLSNNHLGWDEFMLLS